MDRAAARVGGREKKALFGVEQRAVLSFLPSAIVPADDIQAPLR